MSLTGYTLSLDLLQPCYSNDSKIFSKIKASCVYHGCILVELTENYHTDFIIISSMRDFVKFCIMSDDLVLTMLEKKARSISRFITLESLLHTMDTGEITYYHPSESHIFANLIQEYLQKFKSVHKPIQNTLAPISKISSTPLKRLVQLPLSAALGYVQEHSKLVNDYLLATLNEHNLDSNSDFLKKIFKATQSAGYRQAFIKEHLSTRKLPPEALLVMLKAIITGDENSEVDSDATICNLPLPSDDVELTLIAADRDINWQSNPSQVQSVPSINNISTLVKRTGEIRELEARLKEISVETAFTPSRVIRSSNVNPEVTIATPLTQQHTQGFQAIQKATARGIFNNILYCVITDSFTRDHEVNKIQAYMKCNGARILSCKISTVIPNTFCICSDGPSFSSMPQSIKDSAITGRWARFCVSRQALISPTESIFFQPTCNQLPILRLNRQAKCRVSIIGYSLPITVDLMSEIIFSLGGKVVSREINNTTFASSLPGDISKKIKTLTPKYYSIMNLNQEYKLWQNSTYSNSLKQRIVEKSNFKYHSIYKHYAKNSSRCSKSLQKKKHPIQSYLPTNCRVNRKPINVFYTKIFSLPYKSGTVKTKHIIPLDKSTENKNVKNHFKIDYKKSISYLFQENLDTDLPYQNNISHKMNIFKEEKIDTRYFGDSTENMTFASSDIKPMLYTHIILGPDVNEIELLEVIEAINKGVIVCNRAWLSLAYQTCDQAFVVGSSDLPEEFKPYGLGWGIEINRSLARLEAPKAKDSWQSLQQDLVNNSPSEIIPPVLFRLWTYNHLAAFISIYSKKKEKLLQVLSDKVGIDKTQLLYFHPNLVVIDQWLENSMELISKTINFGAKTVMRIKLKKVTSALDTKILSHEDLSGYFKDMPLEHVSNQMENNANLVKDLNLPSDSKIIVITSPCQFQSAEDIKNVLKELNWKTMIVSSVYL